MELRIPRQLLVLCVAILIASSTQLWANAKPKITVRFYSTALELPGLYGSELKLPQDINKAILLDTYEHLENCRFQPFVETLLKHQETLMLSDWHLYEVLARASEAMFNDSRYQIIFQWFILRKAGLDAQLFFNGPQVFLHAPAQDVKFGFYILEFHGEKYINLTARRDSLNMDEVKAYIPDILRDGNAVRPISLEMKKLPLLPNAQVIERLLEFTHLGQVHRLKVNLNDNYLKMMDDYPYFNQAQFFHLGLSPEAEASLLPTLENMLAGRSQLEKVELLLSFVRTAFLYKDDRRRFGHEKPMSPEQTLYHSYSDCEDRSALFFYLARTLLKVPAIVLDFEEHVGVALELEGTEGSFFNFEGKRYTYCEPTGPSDDLRIGEMWEYVRKQKAAIITSYTPGE